jgi:hypothetical protein
LRSKITFHPTGLKALPSITLRPRAGVRLTVKERRAS